MKTLAQITAVQAVPHCSFVRREDNIAFLRKRSRRYVIS